ncbi:MAG: hypothetical protein IPJ11_16995 [Gemmatimonadetes bacterium]|nr:hypothetical protein [Gemmatimonadota bacterium]
MVAPAHASLALSGVRAPGTRSAVLAMTRWIDEKWTPPNKDEDWSDFYDKVTIIREQPPRPALPVSPWRGSRLEPTWDNRTVREVVLDLTAHWSPAFRAMAHEVVRHGFDTPASRYRTRRVHNAFIAAVWQGQCHENADGSAWAVHTRFVARLRQVDAHPAPEPHHCQQLFDIWLGRCDEWGTPYFPPVGWAWPWAPRLKPAPDR